MGEIGVVLAAGMGTRMYPLTEKMPKPLVQVNGTPMVETVIQGLQARGVDKIYLVVGYMAEQFFYLQDKYANVTLIENMEYSKANNISSLYAVSDKLKGADCFICEADLYVADQHIFQMDLQESCYYGKMVKGYSDDWVFVQEQDRIVKITRGGTDCYNMTGISWFLQRDMEAIAEKLTELYQKDTWKQRFWDEVVDMLLKEIRVSVQEIEEGQIFEIDTIDELNKVKNRISRYNTI